MPRNLIYKGTKTSPMSIDQPLPSVLATILRFTMAMATYGISSIDANNGATCRRSVLDAVGMRMANGHYQLSGLFGSFGLSGLLGLWGRLNRRVY